MTPKVQVRITEKGGPGVRGAVLAGPVELEGVLEVCVHLFLHNIENILERGMVSNSVPNFSDLPSSLICT